ncbi:Rieske (2Fe-2S) protein [Halegenticoccus tardaugens]|uniref:Rieske (2Fe-2S) protein n=1 Tax=Halegenticoccus tardaugens TaxID=2071624 RepID=UPI00100ABC2C|nr:Rieske (2Fe-2S) protein [Halegenticoccus tardaugens]
MTNRSENRFEICPAEDLSPGERTIVELNGYSIGVFNVDGEYYALKNDCPHQRAPLCQGKVTGTTTATVPDEVNWEDDGHILRCPWHGWEFDIETGRSVFNPHKVRARSFDTTVEALSEQADAHETADGPSENDVTAGTATGSGVANAKVPAGSGCDCGVGLASEEPPVDTYDVTVEDEFVVVYL